MRASVWKRKSCIIPYRHISNVSLNNKQFKLHVRNIHNIRNESLKDKYSSSPFQTGSGTSIDPLFDPDSIIHPESNIIHSPHHKSIISHRFRKQSSKLKETLKQTNDAQFSEIAKITNIDNNFDENDDDDMNVEKYLDETDIVDNNLLNPNKKLKNDFDDDKYLQQSKIIPGWKKRQKKLEKYGNNIMDPLERPIINKKRIFNQGDKCEGCGVLLQNTDPNKIGYVKDIDNHQKKSNNDNNNNIEMKDIYIPDHQRLLLIDLGIMDKSQKYLTYDQWLSIQEGNQKVNNHKKRKIVLEKAICSRCFQLEHYKKIQRIKENTIIPEEFRNLLKKRFSKNKVNLQQICIIKIVDIFDFHGSFISNLNEIMNGNNNKNNKYDQKIEKETSIILALNKIDLLTSNIRKPVNHDIIIDWAWNECLRFNFKPYAIITICSKTGYNVELLLETAIKSTPIRTSIKRHPDLKTEERYRDIYVIGATNVGKSTLLNYLLKKNLIYSTQTKQTTKKLLTTSQIPATTMSIIPFIVKGHLNTRLLDTPGIINDNNLCLKLTDDEYKMLLPKKSIKPMTFKIKQGQSIILGSLARLDCDFIKYVADIDNDNNDNNDNNNNNKDLYFYLTVFVGLECSVHVTRIEKAEEIINLHGGSMLKPVIGIQRILEDPTLKMEKKQTWNLNGIGLQCAVCDVVFPGIGWISLTGIENIQFTAFGIKDLKIGVRKPLLARDMYRNVKKYQGIPHKKW